MNETALTHLNATTSFNTPAPVVPPPADAPERPAQDSGLKIIHLIIFKNFHFLIQSEVVPAIPPPPTPVTQPRNVLVPAGPILAGRSSVPVRPSQPLPLFGQNRPQQVVAEIHDNGQNPDGNEPQNQDELNNDDTIIEVIFLGVIICFCCLGDYIFQSEL